MESLENAPLILLQYEVPLDHWDAAFASSTSSRTKTFEGFSYNIGIPNCQGEWPEELGAVQSIGG